MSLSAAPLISSVRACAYQIPTEAPEADGTLQWNATTLILVELDAAGETGLGYTYADAALLSLIDRQLRPVLEGASPLDIGAIVDRLWISVRNLGRSGLCACAISAIDTALWDLKARLLGLPLVRLLGARRESAPVYGSGGFTTQAGTPLCEQLAAWTRDDGCRWVKMKVGADPAADFQRVDEARQAIGDAGLFIDANGAHSSRTAIAFARRIADSQVSWFEEPVSSDDIRGLRAVRDAIGAAGQPMDIAAGEYAYTPDDVRRLLESGAVDVLQADVTRCGGISGFLQAAALCEAFHIDLSAHCAPALHRHVACAAPRLRHVEWFQDHVRLESMLFAGAPQVRDGVIRPDPDQPGHGLAFRHADARRYAI
ncbi:mandelate racemase [Pseudomonas sp. gcc21]|uniref:enolase C-terminal domain-like protein n=1 Tax=Pseudomonas sp. gcc21 TaxID=2726989 RepID=UPI0014525E26|nr:enolase C-terminal domain-like protein [Pseudomonas sp. gcc21]QJD59823.1 mandelate racemase [Pseudomonas sp. gcc21]